jgi:hypothetical protein
MPNIKNKNNNKCKIIEKEARLWPNLAFILFENKSES